MVRQNRWLRVPILILGVVGVLWSLTVLPTFWRVVPVREISERILMGDRFKPAVLKEVLRRSEEEAVPLPSFHELARAEAIVRLRVAEDAMESKTSEEADGEVATTLETVKRSLSQSPSDSFLWLTLYSLKTSHGGFDPANLRYLEQSYATAPREAWIALRRNKLVISAFQELDEALQDKVVSEFTEMVDAGLIDEAANNVQRAGGKARDRLLASLGRVNLNARKSLAKKLAAEGVKAAVPGVEMKDRFWR